MFPDADYIKTLASWGCDVSFYVANGNITADQFKQITGKDYVAPAK